MNNTLPQRIKIYDSYKTGLDSSKFYTLEINGVTFQRLTENELRYINSITEKFKYFSCKNLEEGFSLDMKNTCLMQCNECKNIKNENGKM